MVLSQLCINVIINWNRFSIERCGLGPWVSCSFKHFVFQGTEFFICIFLALLHRCTCKLSNNQTGTTEVVTLHNSSAPSTAPSSQKCFFFSVLALCVQKFCLRQTFCFQIVYEVSILKMTCIEIYPQFIVVVVIVVSFLYSYLKSLS